MQYYKIKLIKAKYLVLIIMGLFFYSLTWAQQKTPIRTVDPLELPSEESLRDPMARSLAAVGWGIAYWSRFKLPAENAEERALNDFETRREVRRFLKSTFEDLDRSAEQIANYRSSEASWFSKIQSGDRSYYVGKICSLLNWMQDKAKEFFNSSVEKRYKHHRHIGKSFSRIEFKTFYTLTEEMSDFGVDCIAAQKDSEFTNKPEEKKAFFEKIESKSAIVRTLIVELYPKIEVFDPREALSEKDVHDSIGEIAKLRSSALESDSKLKQLSPKQASTKPPYTVLVEPNKPAIKAK